MWLIAPGFLRPAFFYHIIARGNRRQKTFPKDRDYRTQVSPRSLRLSQKAEAPEVRLEPHLIRSLRAREPDVVHATDLTAMRIAVLHRPHISDVYLVPLLPPEQANMPTSQQVLPTSPAGTFGFESVLISEVEPGEAGKHLGPTPRHQSRASEQSLRQSSPFFKLPKPTPAPPLTGAH